MKDLYARLIRVLAVCVALAIAGCQGRVQHLTEDVGVCPFTYPNGMPVDCDLNEAQPLKLIGSLPVGALCVGSYTNALVSFTMHEDVTGSRQFVDLRAKEAVRLLVIEDETVMSSTGPGDARTEWRFELQGGDAERLYIQGFDLVSKGLEPSDIELRWTLPQNLSEPTPWLTYAIHDRALRYVNPMREFVQGLWHVGPVILDADRSIGFDQSFDVETPISDVPRACSGP